MAQSEEGGVVEGAAPPTHPELPLLVAVGSLRVDDVASEGLDHLEEELRGSAGERGFGAARRGAKRRQGGALLLSAACLGLVLAERLDDLLVVAAADALDGGRL